MKKQPPSADLPTLWKVVQRLDRASIPYMLTGSLAMNFYGHVRATNDIDIVIQIRRNDVETIVKLFEADCYISSEAVSEAVEMQTMFNIIDNESVFKVDFIIAKNDPVSNERFSRRQQINVDAHTLQVISIEDLILAKLEWAKDTHSELQRRDVENIVRVSHAQVDNNYLFEQAKLSGVYETLRELYASLGYNI